MSVFNDRVTFRGVGSELAAALAHPDGDGPFPGIVVIHEAYGLNDNIKDVCKRFAEVGYAALGVDLFSGHGNQTVCMARLFAGMLFNSQNHLGIKDLKAALDYFSNQPYVDKNRLGAIGFCMGGSFAIAWASADSRLKAIAPYYAMNPRPAEAVARLCPVIGSYPDPDFTTNAGRTLDLKLDDYKIAHDIKVYPGAKHSFFNDRGPNYNESAATDSWSRVMAFFKEHI
jgi:carboxymethylenebutenolidase